jgi:thioredoxin reductase
MYDVIVIGGGPAGLSAALVLGRCKRKVLVCDSQQYRNSDSRAMHGFLSRDGTNPQELLKIAREQLAPYPVEHVTARVTRARRDDDGFHVALADGREVEAKRLVLATGVVDDLPDIEGLKPLYGKSVHLCPYCDAWELRGQPLAVHGSEGAALAMSLRTWSEDIVLLTDGAPPPDEEEGERLAAMGVRVIATRIRRLVGTDGNLERVEFEDGSSLRRRAMFLKLTKGARSELAEQLGVGVSEDDGIKCGGKARTSVPGVFVAGDASIDLMFAITAAAEGATAAFAINCELQAEEQEALLREHRANGSSQATGVDPEGVCSRV